MIEDLKKIQNTPYFITIDLINKLFKKRKNKNKESNDLELKNQEETYFDSKAKDLYTRYRNTERCNGKIIWKGTNRRFSKIIYKQI